MIMAICCATWLRSSYYQNQGFNNRRDEQIAILVAADSVAFTVCGTCSAYLDLSRLDVKIKLGSSQKPLIVCGALLKNARRLSRILQVESPFDG